MDCRRWGHNLITLIGAINMQHHENRTLTWNHGIISVHQFAGMIDYATFMLPSGRQVSPFYRAPWLNDPEMQAKNDLLANLKGEWPCVPFGYQVPKEDFPADWQDVMCDDDITEHMHGFGSNHHWQFDASDDGQIALSIDYPKDNTIKKLHRIIKPDPHKPALDISLTIHAREQTAEPLGLHPCFALPVDCGGAELQPGNFKIGRTHPSVVEPNAQLFKPHSTFTELSHVPALSGGFIDATKIPLQQNIEEIVQLDNIDGSCSLLCKEQKYRMNMTWDCDTLPSLILWYSMGGRSEYPWHNRNICIGIEPVCCAINLAPEVSRSNNPIAKDGVKTAVDIAPNQPITIDYRIEIEEI